MKTRTRTSSAGFGPVIDTTASRSHGRRPTCNKHWRYITYVVPPLTCHTSRFTRQIRVPPVGALLIPPRPQSRPGYISAQTTRCTDSPSPTIAPSFLSCAIAATQVSETLPRPTPGDSPSPHYCVPHCPLLHRENRPYRRLILAYSALSLISVASSAKLPNLPCVLHQECPQLHWVRSEVEVRMLIAALELLPSHLA